jgi:hypothetical protein
MTEQEQMYKQQQRYIAQQQKAYMAEMNRAQKEQMRNMQQFQRQQQKEYNAYQREEARKYKYPALTDNLIKKDLTIEIYNQYRMRNMPVPELAVLYNKLKFRRIKSDTPDVYKINNKPIQLIKHACKYAGVSFNQIQALPVIYHNPNGVRYDHNYNSIVPYFYCAKCNAVIYYFGGGM